ncbi:PIN domain-containing protein [Mesorhizobium sp. M0340]|uniref:PIN domain-containing protein n=1 Tax=Mesorhizobium sp. M0340 TaxID=2956939 RepID=UPI0033393952
MLRVLVDTCVWLDIAKDYRQQPLIGALETLIGAGEVELLVPKVVLDEFARNKERVIAETQRSLNSHFRIVREAVAQFADDDYRAKTLEALNEVGHKIAVSGDAVNESVDRIEMLLRPVRPLKATNAIKARVSDRAIARLAPYHRSKNSVGDAILVETYSGIVKAAKDGARHAFVTHNTRDFSDERGDLRAPHADLAPLFGTESSTYWTSLVDLLKTVDPELLEDQEEEHNFSMEPRRLSDIVEAEDRLVQQVWYDRHSMRADSIAKGKTKVLPEGEYSRDPYSPHEILDTIWAGALEAARQTEEEIGKENLGPWTSFEWGMINGKLSALRWVMGDDWDMLDT